MIPTGTIKTGIVSKYDETTMTAVVTEDNPGGKIHNVVCLFDRYDPKNNAFSFRAPSEGAQCLYTTIQGTTYLLGLFPPINYTPDKIHPKDSSCDNTESRVPTGMQNNIVKPGNYIDTNSNGSEDSFTDTEKKTIITPGKLSSVWNLLNFIWENTCQIYRLFSGPLDITAEVTENKTTKANECNTTIKVRKTLDERKDNATTLIDLRMGKDAGIIDLAINGSPLLHINEDKSIRVIAADIDINAKRITYNADEVNMLNVKTVRLP